MFEMKQILISKKDKVCDFNGKHEVLPSGSVFIVLGDPVKYIQFPVSKREYTIIFTLISSRGICTTIVEDFVFDWYFEEFINDS